MARAANRQADRRGFKSTQVFDWEVEPTDERPTDFGRTTTHFAFSTAPGELHGARHKPSRTRAGSRSRGSGVVTVLMTVLTLALAFSALLWFSTLVHR